MTKARGRMRRHEEAHFSGSESVRDVVLGMSDGLTVPFALAAGLSGAVADTHVILIAGVAELVAGGISMGLAGYLAGKSEVDTWRNERAREEQEIIQVPEEERDEVRKVFRDYGLAGPVLESATDAICAEPKRWVNFMMREELNLAEPDPKRARFSALLIGGSYMLGGAIPLAPYLLSRSVTRGLLISVIVTLVTLGIFGAIKGRLTGRPPLGDALRTMLVGAIASGAAYGIARLIAH
ncbi:MAG: VIT1/CCC1 transporter family protein [Thermoanaerobaculia bacterium]